MAGSTSFWTEEKTAELVRLWVEEKLSGSQIAERLGLKDRNAVMGKLHRMGLQRGSDQDPAGARRKASPAVAPTAPVDAASETLLAADAPLVVAEAPAPVAPPPPVEEPAAGHPVMGLKERSCRWPIGDPQHQNFRFCCKTKVAGLPYCTEHAEMAYQPARERPARGQLVRKAA